MPYFKHTKNDMIEVSNDDGDPLVCTLAQFTVHATDYEGLPGVASARSYVPGVKHFYSNNYAVWGAGTVRWAQGDDYIANKVAYKEAIFPS